MNSRDYWAKRFSQLELSQLEKGAAYYYELERQYQIAAQRVQKEIESWYARYTKYNSVSYPEAKRILSTKELEEFRWTVQEYVKAGESLDPKWKDQLERASTKWHVSRLEALKLQMQQQVEALYGYELDGLDELTRKIYTEGYTRSAYEIHKGLGVGRNLAQLDENKVGKVLSKPWAADGSNFSSRVWRDRSLLVNELHTGLTQSLIRGESPDKLIGEIAKKFKVSQGRARTLVMTESAFFASASQKDCWKELGVERYQVVETLDGHTCGCCGELDGKVFKLSEFQVGMTAPPFHPNCRGCTCPYFDDMGPTERAARDGDGKTYMVPGDMTYREWKQTFLQDESDTPADKIRRLAKSFLAGEKLKPFEKLPEAYRESFLEQLEYCEPTAKQLLKQEMEEADFFLRKGKNSVYKASVDAVGINVKSPPSTLAHELFHKIDFKYKVTAQHDFDSLLRQDYEALLERANGDLYWLFARKYPNAIRYSLDGDIKVTKKHRGLSDVLSGVSDGKWLFGYFHSKEYWQSSKNKLPREAWAQIGRILYENDKEALELFQTCFPTFYESAILVLKELKQ